MVKLGFGLEKAYYLISLGCNYYSIFALFKQEKTLGIKFLGLVGALPMWVHHGEIILIRNKLKVDNSKLDGLKAIP